MSKKQIGHIEYDDGCKIIVTREGFQMLSDEERKSLNELSEEIQQGIPVIGDRDHPEVVTAENIHHLIYTIGMRVSRIIGETRT